MTSQINNKSDMKKIFTILLCLIVFSGCTKEGSQTPNPEAPPSNETSGQTSTVTIMLPENMELYRQKMTEYSQIDGVDPLLTTNFAPQKVLVPNKKDLEKISVNTALNGINLGGGPERAEVAYLKIENKTAYVLLNIDLDGWAGVSTAIAITHPIVEKTLLQSPTIESVRFEYAPSDSATTK